MAHVASDFDRHGASFARVGFTAFVFHGGGFFFI
jgi:hypothetical protein